MESAAIFLTKIYFMKVHEMLIVDAKNDHIYQQVILVIHLNYQLPEISNVRELLKICFARIIQKVCLVKNWQY